MIASDRGTIMALDGGDVLWRNFDKLAAAIPDASSGVWTPVDASGAALNLNITQPGTYVREGRQIMAPARLTWPTTASTAAVVIGGLPVVCDSRNHHPAMVTITTANLTFTGLVLAGTNTMRFFKTDGTAITNADLSTKLVGFMAFYFTA